jgi:hypothetical protein
LWWVGSVRGRPSWGRRRQAGGGGSARCRGCCTAGCPGRAGSVRCVCRSRRSIRVREADGRWWARTLRGFLPPAAASPIRTASSTGQDRNVMSGVGGASSGWWVRTKIGPAHRPPQGRESPMALSKPARPASTAPVVSMYSSIRPGRTVKPVIQSIAWSGPATNPSRDIVKPQCTFPVAVCGSVSLIGRLRRSACGLAASFTAGREGRSHPRPPTVTSARRTAPRPRRSRGRSPPPRPMRPHGGCAEGGPHPIPGRLRRRAGRWSHRE